MQIVLCMDCARGVLFLPARFFCLKQDGQDVRDLQDERQVREDLNVYRYQQECGEKSERPLICSGFCDAREGQALALRGPRRVFFVVRGPVLRNRSLILAILIILAILLQTRELLRSSRTFSPCCSDVL